VLEKDVALAMAIADDAIVKEDGKELRKTDLLAGVMSQPDAPRGVRVEPEYANVSVKMDGDVAELSFLGTIVVQMPQGRKPIVVASHKDRFRKVEGRWILIGSEATTISRLSK
jgi:hypothetical protein